MAKVVIIGDALDFQYAGIKVYLEGLVDALQKQDQKNEYIVLRADEDMRSFASNQFVKSTVSKFLHPKSRLVFEIPKAIKSIQPDVVIEPCHFGPYRLPEGTKSMTIIHDLTPILFPKYHPRNSALLHKLLLGSTLKNTDIVLTNSEKTKRDLIQKYPFTFSKSHVLYPGYTAPIVTEQPNENQAEKPFILHVGTIEPRKNLNFALDIFTAFKKIYPDLQFKLAGRDGWKTKAFKEALNVHPFKDDIQVLGYVSLEDLSSLYQNAKAFIFPSFYEGFGLPLLEAMHYGTPIITSFNSSQEEVCGEAALYAPLDDTNEWLQRFKAIMEDDSLAATLIANGKEQAKKFQWNKSANKLVELIDTLI